MSILRVANALSAQNSNTIMEENMIEEVVNSILEAEDVAKRRVADAETTAAEIVNNGEIAVEAMRKTAAEQNKTYFAESMAAADVRAAQAASEYLGKVNAQTDAELARYVVNVDKAVKIILEQCK